MKWCYRCPLCGEWRSVEWAERGDTFVCHEKEQERYTPPGPQDQHAAYVDIHEWPDEMEAVVVGLKGRQCTVPGCDKPYETLDHRVAFSRGGKTSVQNLYPMCEEHNQSKGDQDYSSWLGGL